MKTKQEIKVWLLKNCVNAYGDLDLSGLDFSDFNGNISTELWRVKGNLYQSLQEVQGNLFQSEQKVKGHLYQNLQEVQGNLYQDEIIEYLDFKDLEK